MSRNRDDSAQDRQKIISRQQRREQQPASIRVVSALFQPIQINSLRGRIGVAPPSSPQVCGSGLASRSVAVSGCALPFPHAAGADRLTALRGRTVPRQNQLRRRLQGKKLALDHGVADAPGGRVAQPVFLQHLLDARQAHRLVPGFQQSRLNRFQFPDSFPQNDQQDFPAQPRGELPPSFGPSALRHQALHSLAGKIRHVSLHRPEVPPKRRRQICLRSQPALVQLRNRQSNAPLIA